MLGCRDGLVLITLGLSISLLIQRRWTWAIAGIGLSGAWILLLSQWVYPLFRNGEGPKAAGQMFSHLGDNVGDILFTLMSRPWLAFTHIDLGGSAFYLLVLILPTLPFWRRRSLVILSAAVPLLLVNFNAEASSYRTLIHHYSLPIAVLKRDSRTRRISDKTTTGLPLERFNLGSSLLDCTRQTLVFHWPVSKQSGHGWRCEPSHLKAGSTRPHSHNQLFGPAD